MAWTLEEYIDHLESRQDLIWPQPPRLERPKAKPFLKPLSDVRAVLWDVYGVLIRITDGRLMVFHPQKLRMEVALEKTIKEFKMWNSMVRKPGAPWEYMLQQYKDLFDAYSMAPTPAKGDVAHVSSERIWRRLIERLMQKEYAWDEATLGTLEELSRKVAYFFHGMLQGSEAADALPVLEKLKKAGFLQGILSDSQFFTPLQLLRLFRRRGTLPSLDAIWQPELVVFSHQAGLRKPSPTLLKTTVQRLKDVGLKPREVAYVSCRVGGDLAVARQFGLRTILYAGDKSSLQATPSEVRDPQTRPDRLITDFVQLLHVLPV
ncbi:MAG: HAD family hydrolase [Planctomycetota bacterium]|nr:MAG: HAD family hydrolase [Planctomycetota bacterium]